MKTLTSVTIEVLERLMKRYLKYLKMSIYKCVLSLYIHPIKLLTDIRKISIA